MHRADSDEMYGGLIETKTRLAEASISPKRMLDSPDLDHVIERGGNIIQKNTGQIIRMDKRYNLTRR